MQTVVQGWESPQNPAAIARWLSSSAKNIQFRDLCFNLCVIGFSMLDFTILFHLQTKLGHLGDKTLNEIPLCNESYNGHK